MCARAMMACLLFTSVLACAPPAKRSGESSDTKPDRSYEDEDDKDAVSSKGKKWGGWRWKGKRGDCFYKFENKCFASKKGACQAAGCAEDDCRHSNSAPAKVQCAE